MQYVMRIVVAGVLLGVACVGCAPKGEAIDPNTRLPRPGAGDGPGRAALPAWFPRAVDVRVHPATRYVVDHDELILEARVELLDQSGEPIKDVGRFVCELGAVGEDGAVAVVEGRPRVIHFELDVLSAEDHAEYWDPIARSYVLPLRVGEVDADMAGGVSRLWVTFEPAWPGAGVVPDGESDRGPVDVRVDW
ncbi:MAG: hypothetical protein ACIAXF_09885 [Phycisphaerales bacterium JB063]